jgi:hypothetical protein
VERRRREDAPEIDAGAGKETVGGMKDYDAELMARYGTLRVIQGTADHSPLLAGNPEKPRVNFDLLNWQPPQEMERQ